MPQNADVSLTQGVWAQLTNADVTALRVQNLNGYHVHIKATVGANAPTTLAGSIILPPFGAIATDLTLAQLFPGVTGANRVYAFCLNAGLVSVSHA